MSHPYTPVPANNPATITLPDDGDNESAASVNGPFQDVVDKVAHALWPTVDNTKKYPLASRLITRQQRIPPVSELTGAFANAWRGQNNGTFYQSSVSSAYALVQPLEVPNGVTLTDATVYVTAAAHGALPATMPIIQLVRFSVPVGTELVLHAAIDSSPDVATYDAIHSIAFAIFGEVIDTASYRYFVRLTGEAGANSAVNLIYHGCVTKWLSTEQDPGAS